MGIWDTFSDLVEAVTPWSVVEAEAPAAAPQEEDPVEAAKEETNEEGNEEAQAEDAEKEEEEAEGDEEEEEEEEEDDEEEIVDPKDTLEEGPLLRLPRIASIDVATLFFSIDRRANVGYVVECKQSKQCAGPKHHFDDCVERVQQQEGEGEAKEDCVEEWPRKGGKVKEDEPFDHGSLDATHQTALGCAIIGTRRVVN
ncbi:hypothetical protein BBAD15_g5466 [Beauveria bassiana D1-5]|uniref:Ubiquinol-cytochrome C reductase hinge domain-containing protein n=1 Tax=Beauveria bassiana D1-5 TaxID=1245745 RepID=A0A0A2VS78_BEABA|nr:hypothetical protein BBAD15_g5466 [Beauveria bassiana D1-5]